MRSRGEAERKAQELLQAQRRAGLRPLAGNPLLLTLMATLHTTRGRLPDDRVDLYDEAVNLLLAHWNRQIGADQALLERLAMPSLKLADLREVLEELPAREAPQATLTGSGAIAQGAGATAVGSGSVHIGGSNIGNVNTGTQTRIDTGGAAYVGGDVHVTGGSFVGRDQISHGSSPAQLAALFQSLSKAVQTQAAPAVQSQAAAQVAALEAEVQGGGADDGKLAGIIEGLAGLVPGAIGSVASMFTSPICEVTQRKDDVGVGDVLDVRGRQAALHRGR